jgi:hypothetical protein
MVGQDVSYSVVSFVLYCGTEEMVYCLGSNYLFSLFIFLIFSDVYRNSLPASFNVGYDHGDYRERVDKDQAFLEKLDLNALYKQTELTGFD